MLEIKNVDKYFNKGKKNQIHAINNTTISLEDNGLVALLGPSGCGKTTLLNVIGGLDKVRRGKIFVDGENISSRCSSKVDKIRNLKVGYIFQDYKLIDNLSVYDNVAIVLKMIGIKDKNEIKTRVEYILDSVGMLRYKKRPCNMLSGGERQRVGIARAIVKDPNIILADEPTGNLDSKNSLEIMKIIKAISKDRLVILVTHEQNLAKFYASRIIEIQDGKVVKDYPNIHTDELDYQLDNTLYLKDFDNQDKIKNSNYDINIYSSTKDKIKLDIVVNSGNIYIRSNTLDKVEVIDEASSIELVNDNYKKIEKKDIDKYKFNFKEVIDNNIKKRYSSIFNPVSLIVNGFKMVFDYSILKKILLIGFFLSGMFLMYAVSTIGATMTVKDEDFVTINKEYLSVIKKDVGVDEFLSYERKENINYILPGNSIVNFEVSYGDYYQSYDYTDNLSGSLASIEMIKDRELLEGRMPQNGYEIVIDRLALEKLCNGEMAKMVGLSKIEDMLDREIRLQHMDNFVIVGIVDNGSPSIYIDKSMFINVISNSYNDDYYIDSEVISIIDYELYKDKIEIKKGKIPSNDYEVIVSVDNQESMPLDKEIDVKVNGRKLKIVGYYDSRYDYNYYLVNNNMVKYYNIINNNDMTIYSKDKVSTLDEFRDMNLNIKDSYEKDKEDYLDSRSEFRNSSLLAAVIILVISLLEIFLMMRSSFLSRVKEIGIYRAIGVKKIDIYKMFFGEIFAVSSLACIPGVILMAYILGVLGDIPYMDSYFVVNVMIIFITVVFVYGFNMVIGLLPVFNTIKKRPAEILARHDLD